MGKEIVLRVCVGTFLCFRLGRYVIQRKKNLGHFCLAEEFLVYSLQFDLGQAPEEENPREVGNDQLT